MEKIVITLTGWLLFALQPALSQHPSTDKQTFRVMCYNVENLFDLVDDSLTRDEEYLPGGIRGWNYTRYRQKLVNIARVIVATGWDPPAIVGLCEVESRKTMIDLTRYSPLKSLGYRFIHYESPDTRGIDVALLYQPLCFRPIYHSPIAVRFPHAPNLRTRDVLYVSGIVPTGDTLHCFVCHFPSRLGGELESEKNRKIAAAVVRTKIDSLFMNNSLAKIIIMGDFNDYPDNASMREVLGAVDPANQKGDLVNLMFPLHKAGKGTHKHAGKWGALDQLIVSRSLLNSSEPFYTQPEAMTIFGPSFLLEKDKKFLGEQPLRTYVGMNYQGGYSDHLPIFVDFYY
jgi:endonuclease/exonuclease/phosphatase family metal-dependent hydrolase